VQRISISPDGKFVFTQDQETPRVAVIDITTNAFARSISLPRIAFSSVVTKDGRWLLANTESGKLFVVDLGSGALTKTFDTPDVPVLPTPGAFALRKRFGCISRLPEHCLPEAFPIKASVNPGVGQTTQNKRVARSEWVWFRCDGKRLISSVKTLC
jgi:hypothetical protein